MSEQPQWFIPMLAFVAGFIVAAIIFLVRNSSGKTAQLTQALRQSQEELQAYREKVDAHFATTAELFRETTERYRALYDHLSDGAESLSSMPVKTVPWSETAKISDQSESVGLAQADETAEKAKATDTSDAADETVAQNDGADSTKADSERGENKA
ncbi:MAG: DUF1043 family protein [Gammaproteobacteria bacterium]|nr:DUF1043 family protein [Gammaproteobacteria bacterium]